MNLRTKSLISKATLICTIAATSYYGLLTSPFTWSISGVANSLIKPLLLILIVVISHPAKVMRSNFASILGLALSFGGIYLFKFDARPLSTSASLILGANTAFFSIVALSGYLKLGKNFGLLPALRGITTTGIYQWSRHPIYLSSLHVLITLVVFYPTWLNGIAAISLTIGLLLRVNQEEALLCADAAYAEYRKSVPYGLWSPILSAPILIAMVTALLNGTTPWLGQAKSKLATVSIAMAYPATSLDPSLYDDWGSVFLGNHIFPRLVNGPDRSVALTVSDNINSKCVDSLGNDSRNCEYRRLSFKPKVLTDCNGRQIKSATIQSELDAILRKRSWLLPGWGSCQSDDEVCIQGPDFPDLPRRLESVYFRFGWSIYNSSDQTIGIGPYCLRVISKDESGIKDAILTKRAPESSAPDLIVSVGQSDQSDFDLYLYGRPDQKDQGYINLETQTPMGYFVITNPAGPERNWAWNRSSTKQVLRKHLSKFGLLFETDRLESMMPTGRALQQGKPDFQSLKESGTLILPNYIPECEKLKADLERSWKTEGYVQQIATCEDLVEFVERKVIRNSHDWNAFLTPLSPGAPSRSALEHQYFAPNSSESWVRSVAEPSKYFYRVGLGSTPITVRKKYFCAINPSNMGLSDLLITDLTACD